MKLNFKFDIKWQNIIFLIIAGIINATGVMLLLNPGNVIDGGFSGTSMLIASQTGLSISIFLAAINLPFFIFGVKKLGFPFVVYSLVAILSYTLMSFIYQNYLNVGETLFKLMDEQVLLASIFGGIVSGIGSGLTIRFGGAIDGVEVLAIVFAKKIGVTVGQFVMSYNLILYIVASILFKNVAIGMYSVISYAIGLKVVDFIVDGFDKGKSFTVITDKGDEVAATISKEMGRGVTLLDSIGYYSSSHKTMLYCVVNRFETVKLKKIISQVDDKAFISVCDISEVVGNRVKYEARAFKKKNKNKLSPPIKNGENKEKEE